MKHIVMFDESTEGVPRSLPVAGEEGAALLPGGRVRLRPRSGGDILDRALAGRTAVIERVEESDAGEVRVAVLLEDDPARLFLFSADEVEPMQ